MVNPARSAKILSSERAGGKNPAAFRLSSQWERRMRRSDRGIWKHPSLPKGSRASMTTELAGQTSPITGIASSNRRRSGVPASPGLDPDSARWLQAFADDGPRRESALAELHAMLLRAARREAARRGPRLQITGPELEDLAYQAAGDALLAITQKVTQFRGESRFTTWAYKFVIFEVSAKIGRHFWRHPTRPLDAESWDRLPDRFGFDPAQESEWRDLFAELRRAVDTELTPRQREVFVAIALNGVPADALAIELGSNRNALYKMMFDARRKLRAALVANGYLCDEESRRS
jgi:RNA polymerase sigma-70 factor (ECF subfamily)